MNQTAQIAEPGNQRRTQEAVLIGFMPCLVATIVQAATLYLGLVILNVKRIKNQNVRSLSMQ